MKVWIVTAVAQEESRYGIIERVTVRCFGAFTTEAEAQGVASRHQGAVADLDTDVDAAVQLARWENPGYHQD